MGEDGRDRYCPFHVSVGYNIYFPSRAQRLSLGSELYVVHMPLTGSPGTKIGIVTGRRSTADDRVLGRGTSEYLRTLPFVNKDWA